MLAEEVLLHTKLHIPAAPLQLVARPRLHALLDEALAHRLTLLSAPAGFGKTTILTEWLQSVPGRDLPAAWLSLDSEDSQLRQFLTYLAAAVETIDPRAGKTALGLMRAPQPPPARNVLAALINGLGHPGRRCLLVLDDYHVITSRAVHQAVQFLVDRLPETVHLAIATRVDPPLSLARLRARGQLLEIRADDLRFTAEETAEFLQRALRVRLSGEDIANLGARTEGWIAGLKLAALSLQGRSDTTRFIKEFSGSHRYVLDYLVEEALQQQTDGIQHFLMLTSILDRFCASLCSAVLAEDEASSRETLDYLERRNLFLIALDDERSWYRYHHLFADLLRVRMKHAFPELIPELHLRAAQWSEDNGLLADSVLHTLAAHDNERAAALIEEHGPRCWSSGDAALLMLAARLPAEMLALRPRLATYLAWIRIVQGQVPEALALLRRLVETIPIQCQPPESVWLQTAAELFIAYCAEGEGGEERRSLPDYRALEWIPAGDLGLRSAADYAVAVLLHRRGEFDRAAEILLACVQRERAGQGPLAISLVIPLLARTHILQGRLHEAAELCREGLRTIVETSDAPVIHPGGLNIILGEVLYAWNELDSAEQQIREGLRINDPWDNLVMDATGYSDLANVLLAKGELAGALEVMDKLESLLRRRMHSADLDEELQTLKVRLWLDSGELDRVEAWARRMSVTGPTDFLQGWGHTALARVRLAQGRYAEAQKSLEDLTRLPGAEQRVHRQIRIDLLLALALAGQGARQEAFAALDRCLARAEPGGYRRLFLDSGEPARELLSAYWRAPAARYRDYAQKLLAAFASAPATLQRDEPVDALTARELEVLRLMAEGLSNREIAGRLILAEGTIKFYVHTILDKLQVHNRTQAVHEARLRKLV